jgi:hypothetical protein
MATQGTPLIEPYTPGAPSRISAIETNRFPDPPLAWGFMTDFDDYDGVLSFDAITGTLTGSLSPEGDHLEPTIGQIWPH